MTVDTTYLSIDLDALDENLHNLRTKSGCKLLAVLKADAYGHGAVPLAKHLQSQVDFFGVSCMAEAMELHRAGIRTPILIFSNVPQQAYPQLVSAGIRPTIFTYEDALALSAEAVRQGVTAPFHFAIDTGMSRIGFQPDEESAALCCQIARLPGLCAEGLFTHYATADEEDLRRAQAQHALLERFLTLLDFAIPLVHISNSAGILNFSQHHQMVRAGIAMYGHHPSPATEDTLVLKPVLSWHSRIRFIKTLPAGRQISYGGTFTTTAPTRVATIPVGYADGYCRSLSGRYYVLIHGKKAPILGRVCMDQMMVDVSAIPEANTDDPVVLLGKSGNEEITLEDISTQSDRLHYEFLCNLHRRIPRYYLQGGKVVDTFHSLPT